MAKCPECGRRLDALNTIRFSESECFSVDSIGREEHMTTSFSVCSICAAHIEHAIDLGRAEAHRAALRSRGDER